MTAPVLAKVAVPCDRPVRRGGRVEPCAVNLFKGKCPSKDTHLYPLLTGWCNSGWHEGDKINKPTCKEWQHCPCDCHTKISMMYEIAGWVRSAVDESTWMAPAVIIDSPPIVVAEVGPSTPTPTDGPTALESPAPGIVPPMMARTFAPTPTGQAARGELEAMVEKAVAVWVVEREVPYCTPNVVADEIVLSFGIKRPSTGAIDAIFTRWMKIGFAVIAKKPTRFERYTEDGLHFGLDIMYKKAKRG